MSFLLQTSKGHCRGLRPLTTAFLKTNPLASESQKIIKYIVSFLRDYDICVGIEID